MREISWLAENRLASRMLNGVSKQASKCIIAFSRRISRNMKWILCTLWPMKSAELHSVTSKKINFKAVEFWRCCNVMKCCTSWKQWHTFRKNNQPDASIFKIYFCHKTLHVSGIFCAHHQGLSTVHAAVGRLHAGYVTASKQSQVGTQF
jgi:hypothetical protein